ncbi:uncharacterized protein LOC141629004 [Silene latifolia]|uniref:uncharacterized protein LOC141629004 n=1 Tax=Silene latifolia TaxID=37657 RepID=UPI003D789A56
MMNCIQSAIYTVYSNFLLKLWTVPDTWNLDQSLDSDATSIFFTLLVMDTSWITLPNDHPNYINGCRKFIELAKKSLVEGKTKCPSKSCKLRYYFTPGEIEGHILFKGFYQKYTDWFWHGKRDVLDHLHGESREEPLVGRDDMKGLLNAVYRTNIPNQSKDFDDDNTSAGSVEIEGTEAEFDDVSMGFSSSGESGNEFEHAYDARTDGYSNNPHNLNNKEDTNYKRLFEAANKELYEGCQSFSKLLFLLHLYHIKCMFHWSNESFNKLLELLLQAFPQVREFPSNFYEGKKIINDLGLGYEKIHACPSNCMLFWGDNSDKEECSCCHTSRWKKVVGDKGKGLAKKGEASKVMRYFPLIPRLERIYASSKTAEDMRWHHKECVKDGKLRHPADALAWEQFDSRYPLFASDPRSVRLALASDGFNPYRLMNTTYSTWPVILIPYNLPPWLCMKPSSFILSCIILGKSSPGIDIDVYLQPLISELKLLWSGVEAFDAFGGETFKLRAALYSTINDFPAYAMLSGWSTAGYDACPRCTHSTNSGIFGGKICYVGHRNWLDPDHSYRSEANLFDGTIAFGCAPKSISGSDVLRQQEKIEYTYGRTTKRLKRPNRAREVGVSTNMVNDSNCEDTNHNLWNKKNMDKSRDDVNARKGLQKLGIKEHLWLQDRPNREPYMPPASYTMSTEEKERFLKVLQKIRAPDGYGSNISRCVNMKQRKLINLKSHDNHVLMQDILPVALRASKPTKVIDLLGELSCFFKSLCSHTLEHDELNALQLKIVLILCRMEMEFMPNFFTIMVHLLIHLVEEAKLGGPVQYRWMYPIKRYLAHLKSYVTNKAQPEGSIAEGYTLEETITFCSRYLEGVETIFNKTKRNDDGSQDMSDYLYRSGGRVIGMIQKVRLDDRSLKQAHRYILLHSDEMKEVLVAFLNHKRREMYLSITQSNANEWIINEFAEWLQTQVQNLDTSTPEGQLRKVLAGGLNNHAKRMTGFMINGYKFQTVDREQKRRTQNSGVVVEADGETYYGKPKDIYELDYFGQCKIVMFNCAWVDIHRGVKKFEDGSVCVNFSKLMHTGRNLADDPFIFSCQAKQVFYVEDEMQKGWSYVISTKPRDLIDTGEIL